MASKKKDYVKIPPSTRWCNGWNGKRKKYCHRRPGEGTDHPGEGRCYLHGGNHMTIHGKRGRTKLSRYVDHPVLGERIKELMVDPNLMDLVGEVALFQSLLEYALAATRAGTLTPEDLEKIRILTRDVISAKEAAKRAVYPWSDRRAMDFLRLMQDANRTVLEKHFGRDPKIYAALHEIAQIAETFTV